MKLVAWLVFLFLFVPSVSVAQSKRIPVAVSHYGDDSIGQGMAFALKEAIPSRSYLFEDLRRNRPDLWKTL